MKSKIEWTDKSWNPTRGCARVSPECEHCYAERQARRHDYPETPERPAGPYYGLTMLGKKHGPRWTGQARFVREALELPTQWKRPSLIFVDSMSDLFHRDITDVQIALVFDVMRRCHWHTFQVLTKRESRMLHIAKRLRFATTDRDADVRRWPRFGTYIADADDAPGYRLLGGNGCTGIRNVHLGVSVGTQQRANEVIPVLLQMPPAATLFVSFEPLLERIELRPEWLGCGETEPTERRIECAIVGGESGPGARECNVEWIRNLWRQCDAAGVPCMVKQLGARPVGNLPSISWKRSRKGSDPREWPADLCNARAAFVWPRKDLEPMELP